MDPVTAFSLAGTIVQFLEFTGEVISASRELYKNGNLSVHDQASFAANDLLNFSTKLHISLLYSPASSMTLTEDDHALQLLCRDCNLIAEELLSRLNTFRVSTRSEQVDGSRRGGLTDYFGATSNKKRVVWESLQQALLSVWSKGEIVSLEEKLERYRKAIQLHIIGSLSQRFNNMAAQQAEHFDLLDCQTKMIIASLLDLRNGLTENFQQQVTAITLLLDRRVAVLEEQEKIKPPGARSGLGARPNNRKNSITGKGKGNISQVNLTETKTGYKSAKLPWFHQESDESYAIARQVDFASDVIARHRVARCTDREDAEELFQEIREDESKVRERVNQSILESLYYTVIADRYEAIIPAHEHTFHWIFKNSKLEECNWSSFVDWLRTGNGLYWVNGKAGSGKSTLMKYVRENPQTRQSLKMWAQGAPLYVADFFFWNSGSHVQRSQVGLLRSLLFEILQQAPGLIPYVFPSRWAKTYSNESLLLYDSKDESWSLPKLCQAWKALMRQDLIEIRLFLLIDGLDEYEGLDADIADLFASAAESSWVKVCASSRPHVVFENAFASRPSLRLQDLTYNDIKDYVDDKLMGDRKMKAMSKSEPVKGPQLVAEIVTAANGVFLWVVLVVADLLRGLGNDDHIYDLRRRLRLLPKDLEQLYLHIMEGLDAVYHEQSWQFFQIFSRSHAFEGDWVEPPPLTIFAFSCAQEPDPNLAIMAKIDFLDKASMFSRCHRSSRDLKTRYGGLLEVQNGRAERSISPDMKIGYLHRSVKEFVTKASSHAILETQNTGICFSSDLALLKSCLLRIKALQDLTVEAVKDLVDESLTYARRLEISSKASQINLLDEISNTTMLRRRGWSGYDADGFGHPDYFLSRSVQCGIHHYVKSSLSKRKSKSLVNAYTGRPLLEYATNPSEGREAFVSLEMVSTLLEFGANPHEHYTKTLMGEHILNLAGTSPKQREISTPWISTVDFLCRTYRKPGSIDKAGMIDVWGQILKLLLTTNDKKKANALNITRKIINYPSIEGIYKTASVEYATMMIEAVFLQHPELKQELKELLLQKPKKESCCIQ